MQILTCDSFSTDGSGVVTCVGSPVSITVSDLQDHSVNGGLSISEANSLLAAGLSVLALAMIFSIILKQLK